ncbi:MAG: arginine--tRNA ligase [Planctomycetes bacterium]|nr:arginine--tRNA ligase [Planctomycetota bacterium]
MKQFFPRLAALVARLLELPAGEVEPLLATPKHPDHGDVALPCFALATKLGRKGKDAAPALAAELAGKVGGAGEPLVRAAEAAGPYLNLRLAPDLVAREVLEAAWSSARYGGSDAGRGKTIVIDFSSPNIAKPFHLGHLRSTVIGWSLRQIFRARGYTVVGVNHLGDWGTQFGLMIAAWRRWGDEAQRRIDAGEDEIDVFVDLYVRINGLKKQDPQVAEEGRGWFRRLEGGDDEARALWRFFVDKSKAEFARIYDVLGITHESDAGEAFYNDKMPATVEMLERTGLLVEGKSRLEQLEDARGALERLVGAIDRLEGEVAAAADEKQRKAKQKDLDKAKGKKGDLAKRVQALEAQAGTPQEDDEDEGAGPADRRPRGVLVDLGSKKEPFFAILLKADGGTTYTTRDLTAVRYRAETYRPEQILYVVGNTQRDHFVPWFKIVEKLAEKGEGWAQGLRLEHVGFGNYLGMSTRGGTAVFLDEVLERARAAARVAADSAEKKVQLTDEQRERVARAIGTGAVKFFDLKGNRTNDIDLSVPGGGGIDWERLLNLRGDSGPYLQFAHARLAGILRRSEAPVTADGVDWALLGDPEAQALIKTIADFPDRVRQAAEEYEPSLISRYLLDLAQRIHVFLHERRVLEPRPEEGDVAAVRRARLLLVGAAKKVLAEALDLLGIEAVEQM